jgi:competence ComEA-like helix-hairpin-helix protein
MTSLNLSGRAEKENTKIQSLAFLISICVCAALSVCLVFSTAGASGEKIVLDDKINPNTDSAVSMARLPSFGQTRANAVIEYRENGNTFDSAEDIDKVKGIGPKTLDGIRPYLRFDR